MKGTISLTAFDGQDGDVVHGIDLSVQWLSSADNSSCRINVEETFQVCVAIY